MPDAASNFLENAILDHILRTTSYTQPTNIFVALFTADPGEAYSGAAGAGPEFATANAYNRVNQPRGDGTWNRTNNTADNASSIVFATATGNWGTATHFGLLDSSIAGANLLFYAALNTAKIINSGDVFRFQVGALDVILE